MKAVIKTGGKQYLVAEGDTIDVDLLAVGDKKSLELETLMTFDDKKVSLGKPVLKDQKVTAKVLAADEKQAKVTSIRYKAKKRVRKVRGHRQRITKLQITKIA